MDYPDHVRVLAEQRPDLAREVAPFTGVSSVLAWMQQRGLAKAAIDIVGMDEFEYDFLVQLERDGAWLAFGLT